MDAILQKGREVLALEAKVLGDLVLRLDENFSRAVKLVAGVKGRAVLSGVGKAGIIARKIASTFSSLGTSAFYMHPAEASHGDLGMVRREDVVIFLSNSGESSEITALIPSVKAIGATLISITGQKESTLAKAADIPLDIGVNPEACSFGLAPTSSTTAMLALGDALAVCVMEEKPDFDQKAYAFFHPGGALGKKLLRVRDVMRKGNEIVVLPETVSVKDCLFAITRAASRAGAAVLVDTNGKLAGIFTDGDLRRGLEKDPGALSRPVKDVMTKSPKHTTENAFAMEALKILRDLKIGELPVLNEAGAPVGVLSVKDLISIGLL